MFLYLHFPLRSGVDPHGTGGTRPPNIYFGGHAYECPPPKKKNLRVFVLETSIFSRHLIARSPSVLQLQASTHCSCSVFSFWETVGWTAVGRITCRRRLGHQMIESIWVCSRWLQSPLLHKWQRLKLWWLAVKMDITRTVLYIANVLPLQWAQLTKTVHTARLCREFVSVFFRLHDLSLCWCMFCFAFVSWVISLHVLALA